MRGRKARQPEKKRRTVGYCRVSTLEQAEIGISLAAQEAKIRAYCLATDRDVDEVVVDDGYSAKDLRRPWSAFWRPSGSARSAP